MPESFDPYYKWLGIPPKDQPPHHYRLLGLELFEKDPEVIEAAANRQMIYIQGCATGPYVASSQKLLNEITQARLTLLDVSRKAAYDRQLRAGSKAAGEPTSPRTGAETVTVPRRDTDTRAVRPASRSAKRDTGSSAASPTLPIGQPVACSAADLVIPDVSAATPGIAFDVPSRRSVILSRATRARKRVRFDKQYGVFLLVAIVLVVVGALIAQHVPKLLEGMSAKPPAAGPAPGR